MAKRYLTHNEFQAPDNNFNSIFEFIYLEPDAPPKKVETWPSNSKSIKVFWNPIDESLRNGIILKYRIFHRPWLIPLRQYHRAPRSVGSLKALGAFPGENIKDVNGTETETTLDGLEEYRWYHIRIGGVTSEGVGVTFSINGSCLQRGKQYS